MQSLLAGGGSVVYSYFPSLSLYVWCMGHGVGGCSMAGYYWERAGHTATQAFVRWGDSSMVFVVRVCVRRVVKARGKINAAHTGYNRH